MLSKAATVKARVEKAQSVDLNWESACSEGLLRAISAHADAVGAPKHYIYFSLLTVTASFIGKIKINEEWTEPAIIWSVVAARGEKKTAALKRYWQQLR